MVIELLNSFSKRELVNLGNFVSCNYHNTDTHVVALLNVLREEVIHKKKFDDMVQCVVYRATFTKKTAPKKILNQRQREALRAKMTILLRLIERFLTYEALNKNTAYGADLLYEQLLQRGQFWLFNRHIAKDTKTLNAKSEKGIEDYAHQFKMQSALLKYLHQKGLVITKDNLPELIKNLDIYYLLNKLELHGTCIALTHFSAKKSYDFTPMKAVDALLEIPEYANHPLIRIHRVALDLLENNTIELYEKLIALLNTYESSISPKNLNNFYKIAGNFCGKKIKEGNSKYYRKAFDLYLVMDDKNLLMEDSYMPVGKLKNIITLSCRLNEFIWAEKTIEKYRPNLEKVHADSVYQFNMGAVAFYQKDFKTALSHFIRVEKVNLAYDIDCRIMLLKSHYELDKEYDERTIRTFLLSERFIQSHKGLTSNNKKAYKNFVRILINIYNMRHGVGKMTPEKIRRKLEKLEYVSDKQWLLKKIEELEKKIKR